METLIPGPACMTRNCDIVKDCNQSLSLTSTVRDGLTPQICPVLSQTAFCVVVEVRMSLLDEV